MCSSTVLSYRAGKAAGGEGSGEGQTGVGRGDGLLSEAQGRVSRAMVGHNRAIRISRETVKKQTKRQHRQLSSVDEVVT